MIWVFDIDGTISANPTFFSWLTYHLKKPSNEATIYVVTCRNPARVDETEKQLTEWGIKHHGVFFMSEHDPRDHRYLLEWKLKMVQDLKADIWFDDDIKLYKQLYNIDIKKVLPRCQVIHI